MVKIRPRSVQVQDRVADQFRGIIEIDQAGVDDQVVKQRIIDVDGEILFRITFAAAVFVPAEFACLFRGQVELVVLLVGVLSNRRHDWFQRCQNGLMLINH
jgi:hypothetical protein